MDINLRKTLFLFGCIPIRILLVYIAYILNENLLPYFGIILFIIGFNMLFLYFTNTRLNAVEGGGTTWWKEMRLLHGTLFTCAAFYAFNKNNITYIPLLIDVIIGFISFIKKHYI